MPLDVFVNSDKFKDDPKEIRPLLVEIDSCKNKAQLLKLAKQYKLSGVSSMRVGDLKELLMKEVRNGRRKEIDAFEKRGYVKVKYSCSDCKYTIIINVPKGKNIGVRYCKKCGKELKPKVI